MQVKEFIGGRGTDFCRFVDGKARQPVEKESFDISDFEELCFSSVLHLRGAETQPQPFVSAQAILMYNGEIFASSVKGFDLN